MTARIIGWSHLPFGKHEGRDVESLIVEAANAAPADTGLEGWTHKDGEPAHEAGSRLEAEGRAAGERYPVHLAYEPAECQGRSVDRAGGTAAYVDGRHRRRLGEDRRDTGAGHNVLGIADEESLDVGQAVARSRSDHGLLSS
ncbi:hypothetical protein U1T56_00780 [Geminicoccaceae bacterium SYSU G07066]|uniref:Uncharacterized protein n=1 Tax=Benzoatithermus flavus TaxID=3108223 RepID=A0ABU8XKF1_9PROT